MGYLRRRKRAHAHERDSAKSLQSTRIATPEDWQTSMRMSGKGPYRIHTYSDAQAFQRLAKVWDTLTDRDKDATVFQTWTWVSHMWELEAQGHVSLRLAAAFNGQDQLVALAPMLVERRFGPLNVRILRFIGDGLSDRQDIIIDPEADVAEINEVLAAWFRTAVKDYDIVTLNDLSETSWASKHSGTLLPDPRSLHGDLEVVDENFCLPIIGTWEEYCVGLKASVRQNFRNRKRRLEKNHAVTLWTEDGSVNPKKSIADFVMLHQQRQGFKKERGLFRTPERKRILSRLFDTLLKDGRMKLFFINVDGVPKAAKAVLEFNGWSHWYNVGLDTTPSILRLGLGKLINFIAIEDAFLTRKTKIDLGRGTQAYKGDFASQVHTTYRIVRFYSPLKRLLYRQYGRVLRHVKHSNWIRQLYFLGRRLSAGARW